MLAFVWPSAPQRLPGWRKLSVLLSPRPQSAFQLPPSTLFSLSLSPLSPYPFTFLNTTPPLPVDLHPPPPKFPLSYFHFSGGSTFCILPMFIHDQGSEREIRSQVLSRPPRGLRGLRVSTHTHTHHTTHMRINTSNKQMKKKDWEHTHTHTSACLHTPSHKHAPFFVPRHVQMEAFCPQNISLSD